MTKKEKATEQIFNILAFQYKPLENRMKEELRKEGHQGIIDIYNNSSYARKIIILDKFAACLHF